MVKWVLVFTLFNPVADKIGQYRIYPFDTKAECEAKARAHMAVHDNTIPIRYQRADCEFYSVVNMSSEVKQ